MKRHILFIHDHMCIGGIESALLSVLRSLNSQEYDVTLIVMEGKGELWELVPGWVKKMELPLNHIGKYDKIHGRLRCLVWCLIKGYWRTFARMSYRKLSWLIWYKWQGIGFWEIESQDLPLYVDENQMPQNIDVACAYSSAMHEVALINKFWPNAIKGIFFHDGSNEIKSPAYKCGVKKFNACFAVSKSAASRLNGLYSHTGLTFETMPHIIKAEEIRQRAISGDSFSDDDFDGVRILTVGRLSYAKGMDYAIEAAQILCKKKINFRWYIVGGGDDKELLLLKIKKYDLSKHVILLGPNANPYAYMRDCDIYVQPSRWEAFCLTLAEALCFYKPCIATDFLGAREQIEHEKSGIVVPIGDVETMASMIIRLVNDATLRSRIINAVKRNGDYKNNLAIKKWRDFLNAS